MWTSSLRPITLFLSLGLTLFLAGCPPIPDPTLRVSPPALTFTAADASRAITISFEDGELDWTATATRPWILLDATSGSGNGQIGVSIDRSGLDTTHANSGTVRVSAGGETVTVAVTVAADPPVAEISDQLLDAFDDLDTNTDGLLSFAEAQSAWPGLSGISFSEIDSNGDGFLSESEILGSATLGGGTREMTPVGTAYFPMAVGNSWTYALGESLGDYGVSELRLSVADQFESGGFEVWQVDLSVPELETGIPLFKGVGVDDFTGGDPTLETFWVLVDGAWYAALSREALDRLPDTAQLIPLAKVLQWPTSLAYLQASGLLESALNEITGIVVGAVQAYSENEGALSEYLYSSSNKDTEALFALFLAFGNEFNGYESGDPLTDAFVQLLADSGIGLEQLSTFFQNASGILTDTVEQLFAIQDLPISLAFWTAWEAEFGETYTNSNPVVEASVRLFSLIAFELAELQEEQINYSEDDLNAYHQYIGDLFEAIDSNAGLLAADGAAYVAVLKEFATNYPSDNPAVDSAVGATLNILAGAESLLPALEGHMTFPLDLAGLSTFLTDGLAFSTAYTEANGEDPAAAFMTVLLGGAQSLVDELNLAAPTLNTLAADLNEVQTLAGTTLLPTFNFTVYANVLTDFETFFAGYADSEGDALAVALAIVSGATADTFGVLAGLVDAVENTPYEDRAGSLESLLPAFPELFPLTLSLDDFGIADQSDCIASGIIVDLDGKTFTVASNIFALDLGPALLAFMPLQYGVVNGVLIGDTPTSPIAQRLEELFEEADGNNDDRLSLAEAQGAIPGLTEEDFAEMDRDDDGALSDAELQLAASGADAYEIDDTPEQASPIAIGDVQSRTFHVWDDQDWVALEITEPSVIAMSSMDIGVDTYTYTGLALYDSSRVELAVREGYNPRLTYTFAIPGTYYLLVRSIEPDAIPGARYGLSVELISPDAYEIDDTPEQASPIDIGEIQNRNFHALDDQDWVTFEIVEPAALNISTLILGGNDGMTMSLLDSTLTEIGYSDGYSPLFHWFESPGTYYLLLSPYDNTGVGLGYTLNLTLLPPAEPDAFEVDNTPEQASPIAIGESQNRNFHVPNDEDWVALEIVEPATVAFYLSNFASTYTLSLSLFDSSLAELASSEDYSPGFNYSFESPGTYYLRMMAPSDSMVVPGVEYALYLELIEPIAPDAFEVDDTPEQASPVTIGEYQYRSFHVSEDQDWAAIVIEEPTTLSIYAYSDSSYMTLTLLDSSLVELAFSEDYYPGFTYSFESPGTYYLHMAPSDSMAVPGAEYQLYLEIVVPAEPDAFEVDDTPEQASPIGIGSSQNRNFHVPEDQDWVTIAITEPVSLTLSTLNLGGGTDTTLTLFDPSLTELAYNDDYDGVASQIVYTFDTPGTYYLLIVPLYADPGSTYDLEVLPSKRLHG